MKRIMASTTLCVAAAVLPQSLHAAESRTSVTASVREICRFDASALMLSPETGLAEGQAFEACNSARSYKITATTRSLLVGETVQLGYGNRNLPLEADGNTFIVQRRGPVFVSIPLRLEANALTAPLSVTFAMSAV